MSKLNPTSEQQAIIGWLNGRGNLLINAFAGCAKTSTLLMCVPHMQGEIAIVAFNRDIADEIAVKLSQMQGARSARNQLLGSTNGVMFGNSSVVADTFHAMGWQAWKHVYPDCKIEGTKKGGAGYYKFDRLVDEVGIPAHFRGFVKKAMSYAKQRAFGYLTTFNDPGEWLDLVDHFGLDEVLSNDLRDAHIDADALELDALIKDGLRLACKALKQSVQIADEVIDFDDMLFMPLMGNIRMRTFDWLLVDEAQDTNPVRRALAKKMLRPGGRAIFVGDRSQSIYGFTGADPEAMDIIKADFGCAELPLSETFRCPRTVVARQQHIVPGFRAANNNLEGEVRTIDETAFWAEVAALVPGKSVILCRNTKPLVDLAFGLIKRGIACYVEGKEIGRGLLRLINRWKTVGSLAELADRLEDLREHETQKLLGAGKEEAAEAISDRIETVLALIAGLPAEAGLPELRAKAESLFADTKKGQAPTKIVLMTGHRSKGLEFDDVVIWGANAYQPSKYARKEHQQVQEANLLYVMETRTRNRLTHVDVTPPSREERRMAA